MQIIPTALEGVVILEPRIFNDARGYFFESFSQRLFDEGVRPIRFVQDNESRSTRGVVRGLHFQRMPYTQSKLVRCTLGRVLDVAVDIRHGSPTFGQHVAVELSAENKRQLFIPRGFAHGFAVLSDEAVFQYKCDNYYAPEADGGIDPLDPALGIDWGIAPTEAILSEKDLRHPRLAEAPIDFRFGEELY
ncbi:MAG: dTDP-4-dehydrorhamnose 3,5-epimerase [Bacteroidaceae bacterium]|nr:dTDP-4-dehydrorhamnose 3,5-epimerase [Bacteroidaceae bacterium]